MRIRDDLIQHFAVGGLIAAAPLPLVPLAHLNVWLAALAGLLLSVIAGFLREWWSHVTHIGTVDVLDFEMTAAGGFTVASVAVLTLGA